MVRINRMPAALCASLVVALCSAPAQIGMPSVPAPVSPPIVSADQRLTLAQAEAAALGQSPQLLAAHHQVKSAQANLSGQRVPVNPEFYVGGLNNTVTRFNPGDLTNYAVIATVETNGAIAWRTSQAKNQLFAAKSDAETTRISVRQSVASAYITLQVANAAFANEQESYATAQRLNDLTEKQLQLGAAPETNAIRTRIALTQEESNLIKAGNDVKNARANLNVQIGRNPDVPIDAAEALAFNPITPDLPTLRKIAEANRPELRSAEFNIKAQHAAAGLARSQYFPNVFVGSDFQQLPEGKIEVGLQVPLFDFGSIRGAVRQANEQAHVQEALAEQTRQAVLLDVQNGYDELLRASRTVQAFRDGILPRSESLLHRIEEGYRLGANTILDLMDAESTYRSTRNDYASALGDYRQAVAQLERAIGTAIPAVQSGGTNLK